MTDTAKRPVETPQEWFRFAEENRRVAERELMYDDPPAHTICFLCQSAAEKYLKGYLIAHGWMLEKMHDITRLLELCAAHDSAFSSLSVEGEILNEYITAGRYPGDLSGETLERADAEEAVQIVRRIHDIIRGNPPETPANQAVIET